MSYVGRNLPYEEGSATEHLQFSHNFESPYIHPAPNIIITVVFRYQQQTIPLLPVIQQLMHFIIYIIHPSV
jgi:hypothetical protein